MDESSDKDSSTEKKLTAKKSRIQRIQIMEVNRNNFNQAWPYLLVSLKSADYIAIDLELSGLGSTKGMRDMNVEKRYEAMRESAMTRSIISFGLAFYKFSGVKQDKRRIKFQCQVFNILSLCSAPFTVEPDALAFLARHSFDFNRLIQTGVHYYPSNVSKTSSLRSLMSEILSSGSPLCFHNGLLDIAFIYHHFYSPLPESFGSFCNALHDLFPTLSPVCDSKYLAEYETRMTGSFLEYVFRKCQGDNVREAVVSRWHLSVSFDDIASMMPALKDAVETVECSLPEGFPDHPIPYDLPEVMCKQYANHGFCRVKPNTTCPKLHDVDYSLDLEWQKQEREKMKRRRRFDNLKTEAMIEEEKREEQERKKQRVRISIAEMTDKRRKAVTGCHRAGVDAFMTGFAVLFQSRMSLAKKGRLSPDVINRLPLSGKDHPLKIDESKYAVPCPLHEERFAMIAAQRSENAERKEAERLKKYPEEQEMEVEEHEQEV